MTTEAPTLDRQLPRGPVHNTMIATAKRCPQKYVFKYVRGIRAIDTSLPLRRGLWLHAMLQADALRLGLEKESLLHVPEELNVHGIDEPIELDTENRELVLRREAMDLETGDTSVHAFRYELTAGGMLRMLVEHVWDMLPEEVQEEYVEHGMTLPDACKRIMAGYRWKYRETLDKERPLLVEYENATDIDGHLYHWRIDELLETHDGVVVLRDWKSSTSLPEGTTWKLTEVQLHLYPVALAPHLEEFDATLEIQGVEFDFLRTKPPLEPAINKSGKLSRQVKETDAMTFLRAAKKAGLDLDDEVYDTNKTNPDSPTLREKLEELKDNDIFFARPRLPRSKVVTNTLLNENENAIALIDALHEDPEEYSFRTQERSCDYACEFKDICVGTLYGLDMSGALNREFETWEPDDMDEMEEWRLENGDE